MPARDYLAPDETGIPASLHELLNPQRRAPNEKLCELIEELQHEIRELRAVLQPVPSMILTGRQVIEEFKRINALKSEQRHG